MKLFYLITGYISLVLAVVGFFLPIMPTVPFLIVSAYCFSRSSKRLHHWLLNHKVFGPMIKDWEREGAIPLHAKILATVMLAISMIFSTFVMELAAAILIALGVIFSAVLIYIWTRPLPKARAR